VTATKDNEMFPTSLKKYPLREKYKLAINFVCYIVYNMRMKCANYDIITSKSHNVYVSLKAADFLGIV
jgi:hypothetical protein